MEQVIGGGLLLCTMWAVVVLLVMTASHCEWVSIGWLSCITAWRTVHLCCESGAAQFGRPRNAGRPLADDQAQVVNSWAVTACWHCVVSLPDCGWHQRPTDADEMASIDPS